MVKTPWLPFGARRASFKIAASSSTSEPTRPRTRPFLSLSANTTPSVPAPSADQAAPSHLAMCAALAPPACVKLPPAYSALLPEVIESEDLVRGNGLWQAATQVGALAGAGFGGLVVAYVSPYAAFWVDAGSYLVAAALLQCVHRRIVAHAGASTRGTVREVLNLS